MFELYFGFTYEITKVTLQVKACFGLFGVCFGQICIEISDRIVL